MFAHPVFSALATVLALRLYTTSAFEVINGPLRKLKMNPENPDKPKEPIELEEPHPLPVTLGFLCDGLR